MDENKYAVVQIYPWSNRFAVSLICEISATKDQPIIFIAIYLLM
jgi:hypothetical protein